MDIKNLLKNLGEEFVRKGASIIPQAQAMNYPTDIGATQYRGEVAGELTPQAAAYANQLPVSSYTLGDKKGMTLPRTYNYSPPTKISIARPGPAFIEHHAGGTNADGDNSGGWDEWSTPPDYSSINAPLDDKQKHAAKVAIFRAVTDNTKSFNSQKFNQDLGAFMAQNPQIMNDLSFVNKPEYQNAPDHYLLRLMHAELGAKYGSQLKNTPIWDHYKEILK